jgi:calcium-dependent protein kinase
MYILLCGYPPFKGKNHKEIFDKIMTGKFSFNSSEWRNVTREAKVLIKKMLTFNPDERVSAEEALCDKWVIENTTNEKENPNDKF